MSWVVSFKKVRWSHRAQYPRRRALERSPEQMESYWNKLGPSANMTGVLIRWHEDRQARRRPRHDRGRWWCLQNQKPSKDRRPGSIGLSCSVSVFQNRCLLWGPWGCPSIGIRWALSDNSKGFPGKAAIANGSLRAQVTAVVPTLKIITLQRQGMTQHCKRKSATAMQFRREEIIPTSPRLRFPWVLSVC